MWHRSERYCCTESYSMDIYVLKLYVTGQTPRSERAIANLRRFCETNLNNRYQLFIIDILERPSLAEEQKIMATPTLIKELPLPLRRLIGDLSVSEQVLIGLDLLPLSHSSTSGHPAESSQGDIPSWMPR